MFAPISSTGIISLSSGILSESTSDLSLQEGELSRPLFVNVTTDTLSAPLVARDDLAYQGAVYNVTINKTVTIWYKVVNGNNNTLPTLYGYNGYVWNDSLALSGVELTHFNETFNENVTLSYDADAELLVNVNVSYYYLETNITADIMFFRAILEDSWENADYDDLYNYMTTGLMFSSNATYSDYFVHSEDVEINFNATHADELDEWYIQYKLDISSLAINEAIPTLTPSGADDNVSYTVNLGTFTPNTELRYRAYVYHNSTFYTQNQTVLNTTIVKIYEPRYNFIEIIDGRPELMTEVPLSSTDKPATYATNVNNVTFWFNSSVVRSTLVKYEIIFGDGENITLTGLDIEDGNRTSVSHVYAIDGEYNYSITIFTDRDLSRSDNGTIFIDTVIPSEVVLSSTELTYTGYNKEATFDFSFNDSLSGVKEARLILGDGNEIVVTSKETYTHIYREFGLYEITLVVIDWAGNMDNTTITITLTDRSTPDDGVHGFIPGFTLGLTLAPIVLTTIIFRRRRN